ncbi:DeoR/GlpR family DNA-binding transcription regulator [Sciscionella sediminilitoris]|uniref:DeoR/GlpR family DNA-binding transcription regulator n=1 Tax=Sciscionella sediminilitoris TaxID=1445613 RepID=UPI0004DFAD5A|nr:DeoR/GlpR family DNA-binding transcription regulator [Sciscionella sp. SE31]
MYPDERRQQILSLAREIGRVEVTDLVSRLTVAPETVRRDLGVLERQGQLHRVYGGAVFVGDNTFEPLLERRNSQHVADKERMALAAAEMVARLPENSTVLLDSGSAPQAIARAFPEGPALTVVTNGLPVATELAVKPNVTTWCLGGRLRESTLACVDEWARARIESLTVDLAFVGVDGLTVHKGLTAMEPAEAAVKAAMLDCARERVLLAHHGKIGRDTFCRFAGLADIDVVLTDEQLDPDVAKEIEDSGARLVCA